MTAAEHKSPRLEPLTPERLDEAQRAIYDAVKVVDSVMPSTMGVL